MKPSKHVTLLETDTAKTETLRRKTGDTRTVLEGKVDESTIGHLKEGTPNEEIRTEGAQTDIRTEGNK